MPYFSKLSLQDERILATARGLENAMVCHGASVIRSVILRAPLHGSTSTFQDSTLIPAPFHILQYLPS